MPTQWMWRDEASAKQIPSMLFSNQQHPLFYSLMPVARLFIKCTTLLVRFELIKKQFTQTIHRRGPLLSTNHRHNNNALWWWRRYCYAFMSHTMDTNDLFPDPIVRCLCCCCCFCCCSTRMLCRISQQYYFPRILDWNTKLVAKLTWWLVYSFSQQMHWVCLMTLHNRCLLNY